MTVWIARASGILDVQDVVGRSPVATIPGAQGNFLNFMLLSEQVYTGNVDGQVACVWGLIRETLLSDSAYLWLLTTDLVKGNEFLFVRHSQRVVEAMLLTYPSLHGDCAIGDEKAMKWLKLLGATFGSHGTKSIPFTIRRK